jgi:hypothetical protein
MTSNYKKIIFCLFFFIPFFSHADESPPLKKKIRPPPERNKAMSAAYNESGRICVRGSWDLFIVGSFIYWQPIEENLDLAFSSPNFDTFSMKKEYYKMKFNWTPGFRIAAGIRSNHDDWTISVEYTSLHTKNKANDKEEPNQNITPYTLIDTFNIYNFHATWYLDLDLVSFHLGRSMYIGKCLLTEPYAALSFALIDQRYHFTTWAEKENYIYNPFSRDKTNSWGIGPEIGLNTEWHLTNHLYLITNIAGGILYTSYRIKNKSFDLYKPPFFHDLHLIIDRKFLRPIATLAAGFSWGSYFGEDFWHLGISALYEFHQFWHHNLLRDTSKGDDLSLNGPTFSIKLDF